MNLGEEEAPVVVVEDVVSLKISDVDLTIATSQPEFQPTKVGKLYKAINANQKHSVFSFTLNLHSFEDTDSRKLP